MCLTVHNKGSCFLFVSLIRRFISFYPSLLTFSTKFWAIFNSINISHLFILYQSYRKISTPSKRRPVKKLRFKLESVISGHSTRTTYKNRWVKRSDKTGQIKVQNVYFNHIVIKYFTRCNSENDLLWQNWNT